MFQWIIAAIFIIGLLVIARFQLVIHRRIAQLERIVADDRKHIDVAMNLALALADLFRAYRLYGSEVESPSLLDNNAYKEKNNYTIKH
jgi:hypothetical protein